MEIDDVHICCTQMFGMGVVDLYFKLVPLILFIIDRFFFECKVR